MKYKMICIDMDGTLLNRRKKISDVNKKAIKKAHDMGVEIVVTTGRLYNNAAYYSQLLGVNSPVIAANGAIVIDQKTNDIIYATNKIAYVRKNAQKLPMDTQEKLDRLKLDKGIIQFENELVRESSIDDVEDSEAFQLFSDNVVPNIDKEKWLQKQRLYKEGHLTVAGSLLFMDEPQIVLPKRSAIKIYRYKTSEQADRDYLDGTPLTVEGSAYNQIYAAIAKSIKLPAGKIFST